jgi:hypothetical protein
VLWSPLDDGGSTPSSYSFMPNRIGVSCAAQFGPQPEPDQLG